MEKEQLYFEVFPRILRTHSETVVTIRPLFDHAAFREGEGYPAGLIPLEGWRGQMNWQPAEKERVTAQGGALHVPVRVEGEQEYRLLVEREGKTFEFRLYALDADLFARRPYKGDFHMHTYYSDGIESPAYVAASCRKIGMDFMAITDHRQYQPSLEAMRAFSGLEIDLRIYPGEEVHPPDNRVHILNFGGSFSVNELFAGGDYLSEVQALAEGLENFPEGVERYPFASCVWCYDKIRQGGGLGVFCHPYWISQHRLDVPGDLTDLLFERQPFDALELIGGYHLFELESNVLQVARYQEERAKGRRIPIVGVSDAHGCETGHLFGWYYTIAFSHSSDLPDLVASIKDLYSVAVEAVQDQLAHTYGPFRLARYAQFLIREIFPLHDRLCLEEGRLMLEYAAGKREAAAALAGLKGRAGALYDTLWAR